jgi:hypothetical protein
MGGRRDGSAHLSERQDEAAAHHLPPALHEALLAVHQEAGPVPERAQPQGQRRVLHVLVLRQLLLLLQRRAPLQHPRVQPPERRVLLLRQRLQQQRVKVIMSRGHMMHIESTPRVAPPPASRSPRSGAWTPPACCTPPGCPARAAAPRRTASHLRAEAKQSTRRISHGPGRRPLGWWTGSPPSTMTASMGS